MENSTEPKNQQIFNRDKIKFLHIHINEVLIWHIEIDSHKNHEPMQFRLELPSQEWKWNFLEKEKPKK